jgi:processive 1,2-diacylglycerol beta-glucosyltransferase
MPRPERHQVSVLGFTDKMHELMSVADVVVTKPGGLTTSEALACGAALVVVNPIPGQESRNSDFLLENGAAIKVNHLATLGLKVSQLTTDRPRLARLKENARRLGRPQAAFDVARRALDWPALRQPAEA